MLRPVTRDIMLRQQRFIHGDLYNVVGEEPPLYSPDHEG